MDPSIPQATEHDAAAIFEGTLRESLFLHGQTRVHERTGIWIVREAIAGRA